MKLRMEGEEEERSECSSGCQSGWTMYLDQSNETHPFSLPCRVGSVQEDEDEEEEEEDQSMVSDASSGPPHLHEDDHNAAAAAAAALAKNGGKRRRVEAGKQQQRQPEPSSSFLDDTASSPVFSFSKTSFIDTRNSVEDVLEFSCGFSATHVKGKSAIQKHLGYMQSSSTVKPTSGLPMCRDEGEKKKW